MLTKLKGVTFLHQNSFLNFVVKFSSISMSSKKNFIDLQKYQIISKIGEGDFSVVFRIKDISSKQIYAAKISKFIADDDEFEEPQELLLLFREVNIMSILNHPSIIKFIGYSPENFEGDSLSTIIMEFAQNGSLGDIISMESQGLSPFEWTLTKKLIILYGVASGMEYLHYHSILHRNLKPQNILLDDSFHPKISGFGLLKITDFLSVSMNCPSQKGPKGTPAYMAPEVWSDEKYS